MRNQPLCRRHDDTWSLSFDRGVVLFFAIVNHVLKKGYKTFNESFKFCNVQRTTLDTDDQQVQFRVDATQEEHISPELQHNHEP